MRPVTFNRPDAAVMWLLAPPIRFWSWVTGRTPQALARVLLFFSLVSILGCVWYGRDWVDYLLAPPWFAIILFGAFRETDEWEVTGDVLPRFSAPRFRVLMALVAPITTSFHSTADVYSSVWGCSFVLALYATTWVGSPPESAVRRAFRSLASAMPRLTPIRAGG